MLIDKIKGLNLKKPIEIVVTKYYTAECEDLNLHGQGLTRAKAIQDFKFAVTDIYEDFEISNDDDYTDGGKEYEDKFLAYFD